MNNQRTGVLLLNMGGPDKLDEIPAFLYNLFSDREIIKLGPAWLQKPLAWFISRRRAPKSRKIYAAIGGGSPLRKITQQQAKALEDALGNNSEYIVRVAMRYWEPSADAALADLLDHGVQAIIALPLYPHYSRATTGSSMADLRRAHQRYAGHIPLHEIPSWPDHSVYIDSLTECIEQGIEKFNGDPVQIVYSAHSLPVSFIDEGDPYVNELHKTIAALEQQTCLQGRLCYQSRSGPVEWLSPATSDMLKTLAEEGCRNILMVPISFVSDHVETLYEINMLFKEEAAALGMRLISSPSLNTSPTFIRCLRDMVLETVSGTE